MTSASAPRSADDAFQDVLLALFQLHGEVLQAADVMSRDFDLTGARWQVMKVVARRPMTVSQIARRLGLQRQSVQRTVDLVRGQGLVAIQPNLDHQRAGLVTLSAEGERVLAALHERQQTWLARCMRGLTRADLEQLAHSLGELSERVGRATARERAGDARDVAPRERRAGASVRRRLVAA